MQTGSLAKEVAEYKSALDSVVVQAREEDIPFSRILSLVEGYGSTEGLKISDELKEKLKDMVKERKDVLVVLREEGDTPDGARSKLEALEKEVVEFHKKNEIARVRVIAFNEKSKKKENNEENSMSGAIGAALGFLGGLLMLSKLRSAFGGAAEGQEGQEAASTPTGRWGFLAGLSKFMGAGAPAAATSSIKPDEPKPPSSSTGGMV